MRKNYPDRNLDTVKEGLGWQCRLNQMARSELQYSGWRLTLWPRRPARHRENMRALPSYQPPTRSGPKKFIGGLMLMLFCFAYGFFFSVLVPNFFAVLVSPLIFVLLLVVWALPDGRWAPTRAFEWLFYATFISLIIWPNYLAIALPGLPWITLLRLTSFPLDLVLLICISISAEFRADLIRPLRFVPAIPILLGAFVVVQLFSIGLSTNIASSIQKFVVAQTTWTAAFIAGAYIFQRPGQIKRWAMIMWGMAIFVSSIAIWEFHLKHVPWLGHTPSFLKINDEAVQSILAGNMRAGTNLYRAQAIFSTPLGLAEYLALTLPFVMHFMTKRFTRRVRAAATASIPLILYGCYLTNSKLGMVGSLLGILLYVFGVSFQNWRRNKQSLIAMSFLLSYPLGVGLVFAAMYMSHRFSVLILGNDGSHAASTAARVAQYTLGLQKTLEWPFGYGIGMGAATLGFGEETGGITIDTYYLSVLLEYGIEGFVIYYGMFAIAIYESGKRSLFALSETEERSFLLPIAISLTAFFVIKSVFSQQDNHPVAFMMLGAVVALVASSRRSYRKMAANPGRVVQSRLLGDSIRMVAPSSVSR
jgi:hypothetical protein